MPKWVRMGMPKLATPCRLCTVASISIAAFAFWYGPGRVMIAMQAPGAFGVPDDAAVIIDTIWLGWLWIFSFAAAAVSCRWRSLALLVIAPFALFYPSMWVFSAKICDPFGLCYKYLEEDEKLFHRLFSSVPVPVLQAGKELAGKHIVDGVGR